MQELVFAESDEPEISATQILPLLVSAADAVNLLYEGDNILLRSTIPDPCPPVLIDRERTLEALTSVLLVAHSMSRARDTVELIASSTSSSTVQILIRNAKSYALVMNVEASLGIALAEAKIRSQKAEFSLTLQPFRVQIELPKTPFTN
jgi:hypothetical protein